MITKRGLFLFLFFFFFCERNKFAAGASAVKRKILWLLSEQKVALSMQYAMTKKVLPHIPQEKRNFSRAKSYPSPRKFNKVELKNY